MVKFHCKDNQKALQDFKHLAGLFAYLCNGI
jgi:hypothetical protein